MESKINSKRASISLVKLASTSEQNTKHKKIRELLVKEVAQKLVK
jgi:hypothetical protein